MQTILREQPDATMLRGPEWRLNEELLASFDRAVQASRFDDSLFDGRAGFDFPGRLEALVTAMRGADLDVLASRRTWRHALFGADVEARLRFALARQNCEDALLAAKEAARATAERIQRLEAALPRVQADQARLTGVAAKAERMTEELTPPATLEEQELHTRFHRRLANLSTVRAANALTLAQIPVAIAHYRELLDRFTDAQTVLFPVWERHALALVQAPPTAETISAARAAAQVLLDRLVGKLGGQA